MFVQPSRLNELFMSDCLSLVMVNRGRFDGNEMVQPGTFKPTEIVLVSFLVINKNEYLSVLVSLWLEKQ